MKTKLLLSLFSGLALLTPPGGAAEVPPPEADRLLRQMSAKLAAAHTFRFQATRAIDPVLVEGTPLAAHAQVTVTVRRPNQLAARSTSQAGARRFIFDGHTLSLLDEKKRCYAVVPLPGSLDGLIQQLDERYGFIPPLAEFTLSNPYAEFRRQARTVTYLGRVKAPGGFLGLGGVECHRLALKGKIADAELWIAVGDTLPRRLVATFHGGTQPQVRIDFSAWQLAPPVTARDFTFVPPRGAEKIELWTTARMQSATAQH
jgi:hypothetical protein